jgi:hypothetical protein
MNAVRIWEKRDLKGYGPEQDIFLKTALFDIRRKKHNARGKRKFCQRRAKSDIGNILDILSADNTVCPDPVYPSIFDTNVMAGANPYMNANSENGFCRCRPVCRRYHLSLLSQ